MVFGWLVPPSFLPLRSAWSCLASLSDLLLVPPTGFFSRGCPSIPPLVGVSGGRPKSSLVFSFSFFLGWSPVSELLSLLLLLLDGFGVEFSWG